MTGAIPACTCRPRETMQRLLQPGVAVTLCGECGGARPAGWVLGCCAPAADVRAGDELVFCECGGVRPRRLRHGGLPPLRASLAERPLDVPDPVLVPADGVCESHGGEACPRCEASGRRDVALVLTGAILVLAFLMSAVWKLWIGGTP